jgi:hypothetical protein
MTCGTPTTELRAAVAVIEHAFKGADLVDLADRVATLEATSETTP